jgi:hypothetical protein
MRKERPLSGRSRDDTQNSRRVHGRNGSTKVKNFTSLTTQKSTQNEYWILFFGTKSEWTVFDGTSITKSKGRKVEDRL